ncbi:MAG: DUF1501 domain-containing protein [Planctomycetota bacterium]|nr:DUF1501 domain-containing protein [Planctomycetota bacterium]
MTSVPQHLANDEPAPGNGAGGVSRRHVVTAGAGIGGLGAVFSGPSALEAFEDIPTPAMATAKRCIVLFLLGGPPQHETWDPKPDAAAEVRGPYQPIATAAPGLMVNELMPRTAMLTDQIAVLRAMSTNDNAHSSSGYWMLTGRPHAPTNTENATPGPPNDSPCLAALVKRLSSNDRPIPAAIRLPEEIWNTGRIVWPGQDGGWLGRNADPWLLTCNPNDPEFIVPDIGLPSEVSTMRFDRRRSLLQLANRGWDQSVPASPVQNWDLVSQQALGLLQSSQTRKVFDLDEESPQMRDQYGRNRFGQSVLLARRLMEAGVRFVQVNWTRWDYDTSANPAWDTHAKNADRLKNDLMPPMDLAYSALLQDLQDSGMLDDTLVVWMGEFGRTPRINGRGGRDHWGHVYSAALAGGGIRGGVVHGASDPVGAYPKDGRTEPQDLAATIFHCLGYSPDLMVHDTLGRPMPISTGHPIRAIL